MWRNCSSGATRPIQPFISEELQFLHIFHAPVRRINQRPASHLLNQARAEEEIASLREKMVSRAVVDYYSMIIYLHASQQSVLGVPAWPLRVQQILLTMQLTALIVLLGAGRQCSGGGRAIGHFGTPAHHYNARL